MNLASVRRRIANLEQLSADQPADADSALGSEYFAKMDNDERRQLDEALDADDVATAAEIVDRVDRRLAALEAGGE